MTPLLLCLAVLSSATPPSASTRPTFSAGTDLPVAGALVGTWVVSETLLKKPLAPLSCRWCETNDFDMSVRRAFNPGLSPSPQGERIADISSGVVGFAVLPLALVTSTVFPFP